MTAEVAPFASVWPPAVGTAPVTNSGLLEEADAPLALRMLGCRTTLFDGQVRLSGPVGLALADFNIEMPATASVSGWPSRLAGDGNPDPTVRWPAPRATEELSGRKMGSAPNCGATVTPAERMAACAARNSGVPACGSREMSHRGNAAA